MKKRTIGVLGLGIFGSTIAKELGGQNFDVVAIDKNLDNVNRLEPYVVQAIQGDFRDLEILKEVGIPDCDVVIVASGQDLESSALAIVNCRKLGVEEIVVKSKNRDYMEIMLELGATQVIRPEKEMGMRLARNLMRNNILDVVDLDDETAIVEFQVPKKWIGKTFKQLDVRKRFGLNIIGLKENPKASVNYQLSLDQKITNKEMLIVAIGNSEKFEHLDYTDQLH